MCRIGQSKPTRVVRLMLAGTLEADVLRLQARLGQGRGGGAADELVTGEDLAILFGIRTRTTFCWLAHMSSLSPRRHGLCRRRLARSLTSLAGA